MAGRGKQQDGGGSSEGCGSLVAHRAGGSLKGRIAGGRAEEQNGALETCRAVTLPGFGGHPAAPGQRSRQPHVPSGPGPGHP